MDDQGFSKEELIKELEELRKLQQKYISSITLLKSEIEEYKQLTEKLEKDSLLLQSVIDETTDAIYVKDINGKYILFNHAAETITGKKSHDVLLNDDNILFPADEAKIVMDGDRKVMKEGITKTYEESVSTVPGKKLTFLSTKGLVYAKNGKPFGLFGIARDITERKEVEESLRKSEDLFNKAFHSSPSPITIARRSDGQYIAVNDSFLRLIELSREEVIGKKGHELGLIDSNARDKLLRKVQETGVIHNVEVLAKTKTGKPLYLLTSIENTELAGQECTICTMQDVTERKRTEELLNESENKFRKIYEKGPYGMALIGKDFKFLMANATYCQIVGYSEKELQNLSFSQITHPDDINTDIPNIKKLISGEIPIYKTEKRYIKKDGQVIWGALTVAANFKDDGQFLYNTAILNDITERKNTELLLKEKAEEIEAQNEEYQQINEELHQANQELQLAKEKAEENKETFQMLFESINDAVFISEVIDHGKSAKFIVVNDIACQRLGYTREELLTKTPFDINSEKSKPTIYLLMREILEKRQAIVEVEHVTKNGTIIPVEISLRITQFKNKTIIHSIARDITNRNKAAEALKQSEDKFRKAFFTNPDAITINRLSDGKYISANKGFTQIFEYSEEDILENTSKEIDIWHNYEDRSKFVQCLQTNRTIENFETQFNTKSGKIIDGLVFSSIIELEGSSHILTITRDITERKRAQILLLEKAEEIGVQNEEYQQLNEELIQTNEELLQAKERAERSDHLKTAFLQNMSHEIRTPMNAIMGFSGILVENFNHKEKLEQFTQIINQRCADLLDIINEILDVAKIEFSEISFLFAEYQKRQNKQHLRFSIQKNCGTSGSVILTDQVKLKQILINLIGNAFKFTDNGEIQVGCKLENNQRLVFYVSDTGIGIPFDKQNFIFERFAQLEPMPGRLYGGTGLGLSIVKGLVELLNGEIWIKSAPGKGTTFYFTIPHNPIDSLSHQPFLTEEKEEFNFSNKTILIVEDDIYNADFLKEALEVTNINIIHAIYGKEAVELSKSQKIDIVLMDIRLPDLDGYTVTQMILKTKPGLNIIAQTAYALKEDKERAISSGCIDHISKPVERDALLSTINKYLK